MKEIELTQGKTAFVDDEDFDYINQWKWYLGKRGTLQYGVRNYRPDGNSGPHVLLLIHRVILEYHKTDLNHCEVDHIDGNGLNNCKSNLRPANRAENSRNSVRSTASNSPYKGVTFSGRHNMWVAQICVNGKHIHCGYHLTSEDAAVAYNKAAEIYFGNFARSNPGLDQPNQSDPTIYTKRFRRKRQNTTSKYRGVSLVRSDRRWVAQIEIQGKNIYCGRYATEEEAAKAYNDAVLKHFGYDSTRLNKILEAQDR